MTILHISHAFFLTALLALSMRCAIKKSEQVTNIRIEKQTHKKQEAVTQEPFALDETEYSKNQGKESPKVKLGKQ